MERKEFILKKGLCLGCLRQGHRAKDCKKKSICDVCKHKHPTCLHGDYEALNPVEERLQGEHEEETAVSNTTSQMSSTDLKCLMTVPVYISSATEPNEEHLVYALLDTQSDTTFISEDILQKLNAPSSSTRLKISTVTSSVVSDEVRNLQ